MLVIAAALRAVITGKTHVVRVGLGEDGADHAGDHLLLPSRQNGEHVAQEVDVMPTSA